MKQTGTDVNRMVLHGRAAHPPAFSHRNHEVEFFSFPLVVGRLSGAADQVNVMASRALLEGCGWLERERRSPSGGRCALSTTAPGWGAAW